MIPLLERLPLTPATRLTPAARRLTSATRQWPVWGTTARIVVTDPRFADDARALVEARLRAIDEACSRFRDDSELARVQRRLSARPGRPVTVSALLAELIEAGLEAARRTDGDVDPTLADDLCALGYDRDYALIRARIGTAGIPVRTEQRVRHRWADVRLAGRRLSMPAGTHLDLGASAKAFAADRTAAAVAKWYGCGVLVALGGDIATAGPAPATGWQVLVPDGEVQDGGVRDGESEPSARIRLQGGGLATSSTISRSWVDGADAVHHLLDPASGRPAEPVWRTVSVAAADCAQANAVSTAAIVRGSRALPWLRETGWAARLVGMDGDVVTVGGWPAAGVAGGSSPSPVDRT